jgi:hypothetical protein
MTYQDRIYGTLTDDEYLLGQGVSDDEFNKRYGARASSENHSPAYEGGAYINASPVPQSLETNCEDDGNDTLREGES